MDARAVLPKKSAKWQDCKSANKEVTLLICDVSGDLSRVSR